MEWQLSDPAYDGFRTGLPRLAGAAIAMAPVADYRANLFPAEEAELGVMAEVRQLGFSSGRHCAHLAQSLLGLTPAAVLREDRVPIWPAHSVGSITHSGKIAAAMASNSYSSVGLDIEETGRVGEKLHRILFTDAEKERLTQYDFDAATVMFSAKEAGYKAIYRIGQAFIGFTEAMIELNPDKQTFTIEYLGDHEPNKALQTGHGYWQQHLDHILTVFVIP